MGDIFQKAGLMLQAFAIVGAGGGLACIYCYWRLRRQGERICIPQRPPRASWQGMQVFLGFLIWLILPSIFVVIVDSVGFFRWVYGPDFPALFNDSGPLKDLQTESHSIRSLWVAPLCLPLQLFLIGLMLRMEGASWTALGLMPKSYCRCYIAGMLTWLIATPLAFITFAIANAVLTSHPDTHPLTQLGPWAGTVEWSLFGFQVTILAPAVEEALFRGVLLFWLLRRERQNGPSESWYDAYYRPHICMGIAFLYAVTNGGGGDSIPFLGFNISVKAIANGVFILSLLPILWLAPRSNRLQRTTRLRSPQMVQAIVASSALFASFHASVWPSPLPLFVLALGLGWITIRTGTWLPAFTAHGLFNAISAVYLLLGGK